MSTINWTGGASADVPVSGLYRDPSSWSSGRVPGINDDVILGGQGYIVTLKGGQKQPEQANSLEIDAGTQLRVVSPQASTDANSQSSLSLHNLDDKGSIVLAGGQISSDFGTIEKGATVSGWGALDASLSSYGDIVATTNGDGILHTLGGSIYGNLRGAGEIDLDATSDFFSDNVTVSKLRTYFMYLETDLNLKNTYYSTYEGIELQGHTLTLKDSLLEGAQVNFNGQVSGTIHNIGNMITGSTEFFSAVKNDGSIKVHGSTSFSGNVLGKGVITVNEGNDISFSDSVKSTQAIELHGETTVTLSEQKLSSFQATISGFDSSDHFDFSELQGDQGKIKISYIAGSDGGDLMVRADNQVASIHLVGDYVASGFQAASDGEHGILVSYHDASQDTAVSGSILHL